MAVNVGFPAEGVGTEASVPDSAVPIRSVHGAGGSFEEAGSQPSPLQAYGRVGESSAWLGAPRCRHRAAGLGTRGPPCSEPSGGVCTNHVERPRSLWAQLDPPSCQCSAAAPLSLLHSLLV